MSTSRDAEGPERVSVGALVVPLQLRSVPGE